MRAAYSWMKGNMLDTASKSGALVLLAVLMGCASAALAEPGDAQAVAQARRDYANAMKGHDIGLQNAMRAQLAAQLAKSRENTAATKNKRPSGAAQQPNTKASAS